jgi:uncharacterized OB-fold protein
MTTTPPIPSTDDPDTAGFWEAAAQGKLVVRVCVPHGHVLHLPKEYCHYCGSWETIWRAVDATGRIYSFTQIHHGVLAGFHVPYTVLLIELVDAPEARLIGHLDGTPDVAVGMLVRAEFEERVGAVVPRWALADENSERISL